VPFRNEVVSQDKQSVRLSSGDLPVLADIANIEVAKGSLDDLGPGTIAVLDQAGAPRLGTTVTVADNTGQGVDLKVVAVIKPSIDATVVGSIVDRPTFDKLVGDVAPTVAFVDLKSGAQTSTRHAIQRRVDLRPDIDLQEGNAVGRLVGSIFDFMINAVIGLLLMSVLIALIGIINTLSLSILERRRELGLLRVIGMTDDRVQRMVRLESLLISGLGTISGMAAGLIMSAGLIFSINRLSEETVALSFPFFALLGVLIAGVVLGVLASLIPSRRSTRLEVLDAIGSV
jgi:putative ABC transport system permease protein